jgi:hypothetical protein
MSTAQSPARRRAASAVRRLTAAALGALALTVTAAVQAQAATPARTPIARAAAGFAAAPQPIPLNTANWTGNAGFGSRAPAWYTDGSGIVHLQGAASQTTASGANPDQIGTLPTAARPSRQVSAIVHTFNGTFADVTLEPTGEIFAIQPSFPAITDFSFVSLEGISYRPSRAGNPIALNTANWVGNFPCCRRPAWYTDGSGVVHLQGTAGQTSASGTGANLIGTLPPAARPAQTVYTIVDTAGDSYADLAIEPNGTINLIDPRPPGVKNYILVFLESISYRPAGQGQAIAVNTANWTASAGFGSRPPAWYKDSSGLVHLQGAASQTSATGTGANVIGTLPSTARPRQAVYTIVHTFNGTYADLAIEPNGTLALIDPRPPMVKDYTFVSLESITYRR